MASPAGRSPLFRIERLRLPSLRFRIPRFDRVIADRVTTRWGRFKGTMKGRLINFVFRAFWRHGTEDEKPTQTVVRGYFQYHAIPGNEERLKAFRREVLRMWLRQLQRRSQRSRWTWARFLEHLEVLLPEVTILHPWPPARFAAKHPR